MKQKYIYPGEEIGIYAFIFPNNKCYVGMTTRSFNKRWKEHYKAARGNKHNTPYIQSYYNKYKSFESVEKIILEKWIAPDTLEELIEEFVPLIEEREVFWWEEMDSQGYIMVHGKPTGTGSVFHSIQSRKKTSASFKKRINNELVGQKIVKCKNPNCINTFTASQSSRKKYCSEDCYKDYRYCEKHNIILETNLDNWKNENLILTNCDICNVEFKYTKGEKQEIYCSRFCNNKHSELLTYDLLYELYINKEMTCKEISDYLPFKVSAVTVRHKLIKWEIPLRPRGIVPYL